MSKKSPWVVDVGTGSLPVIPPVTSGDRRVSVIRSINHSHTKSE